VEVVEGFTQLVLACNVDSHQMASGLVFTGRGLDWGALPLVVQEQQRVMVLADASASARLLRSSPTTLLAFSW
jgi:hypothetical protein